MGVRLMAIRKLRSYAPKTLARDLDISLETAKHILDLFKGESVKINRWDAFNAALEGYGREYAQSTKDRQASYNCDSSGVDNRSFYYINMGDPYVPTIVKYKGYFRVCPGGYADIVERGNYYA
jgi:hypothetical protein